MLERVVVFAEIVVDGGALEMRCVMSARRRVAAALQTTVHTTIPTE
jgi:hypothetical protein